MAQPLHRARRYYWRNLHCVVDYRPVSALLDQILAGEESNGKAYMICNRSSTFWGNLEHIGAQFLGCFYQLSGLPVAHTHKLCKHVLSLVLAHDAQEIVCCLDSIHRVFGFVFERLNFLFKLLDNSQGRVLVLYLLLCVVLLEELFFELAVIVHRIRSHYQNTRQKLLR